jgi:hypothetical protein
MLRTLACVVVVASFGCSAKPLDREQAQKSLMAHAEQMREATLQEDHRRLADLTHPSVVKGTGGKEQFTQRLAEIAAEGKSKGFSLTDIAVSEPSDLVTARGALYALVPFTLQMTGPGGAKGVKPSFLIGTSTDGGISWKFIDGEGVAGNWAKIRQLLPDFPDQLILPQKQSTQWKR